MHACLGERHAPIFRKHSYASFICVECLAFVIFASALACSELLAFVVRGFLLLLLHPFSFVSNKLIGVLVKWKLSCRKCKKCSLIL